MCMNCANAQQWAKSGPPGLRAAPSRKAIDEMNDKHKGMSAARSQAKNDPMSGVDLTPRKKSQVAKKAKPGNLNPAQFSIFDDHPEAAPETPRAEAVVDAHEPMLPFGHDHAK